MNVSEWFKQTMQSKEVAASWIDSFSEQEFLLFKKVGFGVVNAPVFPSLAQEKIATNLAGFFGMLGGLGFLCNIQNQSPAHILAAILAQRLTAKEKETFCRFANVTWKVSQPLRDIERISRPPFIPFSLLPAAEQEKDWVQISAAADYLHQVIPDLHGVTTPTQWQRIADEMQNPEFLKGMAKAVFEAYYTSLNEDPPTFLEETDLQQNQEVTVKATWSDKNLLTGFYVLECFCDASNLDSLSELNELLLLIQRKQLDPERKALIHSYLLAALQTGMAFQAGTALLVLSWHASSKEPTELDHLLSEISTTAAIKLYDLLPESL